MCDVVERMRPEVVSFHFGLPAATLLERVKATGARVISSATTLAEAEWLAARGVDAIIAQGAEAGGHSGTFLDPDVDAPTSTFALVPLIVDRVRMPVIAAGGIADGRGIAAAFALGASGVQIGSAYLLAHESRIGPVHRAALAHARGNPTRVTNLFTGRPARGIVNRLMRDQGFVTPLAPIYPLAANALAPLRRAAEERGRGDFSPMWAGEAVALAREAPAGELTRRWAAEALSIVGMQR
jgi:nitronate monooxygenase